MCCRQAPGTPQCCSARRRATNRLPTRGSPETFGLACQVSELAAQLSQFGAVRALGHRCRHVLRCAPDLEHPIDQLDGFDGGQDHRISRNRRALDRIALFVGPLTTRLTAVPAAPSDARDRHLTAAPHARVSGTCSLRHSGARALSHESTLYSRFGRLRCTRAVPGKMGRLRLLATREPIGCPWRCR